MKKFSYLLLIALTIYPIFRSEAQDLLNLGKSFSITQNYLAKSCNATGGNSQTSTAPLLSDFIIIVEAMTIDSYLISVPNFSDPDEKKQYENQCTAPEVVFFDSF